MSQSEVVAQTSGSVPAAFDCGQLDAETATEARETVARFRQRSQTYFMDTGRDLLAMKAKLGHGLFLPWVETEMGLTPRTAQNFMQAADQLGHKSEIVSYLPPTTLYRLAAPSTPAEVREEVLELAARGRADAQTVDRMVADGRAAAKEAKRKAGLSAEDAAKEERAVKRREAGRKRGPDKAERERLARFAQTEAQGQQAAEKAAALIIARFGNDLPELVSALNPSNRWGFFDRLLAILTAAASEAQSDGQFSGGGNDHV